MSTHPVISPPVAPAADSSATARLVHNRARLAQWLAQDRAAQARPTLGGWAARAVLPLIEGLHQHPTASLALGALAQAWLRSPPRAGRAVQPLQTQPLQSQLLGAALNTARQHPKTTFAVAAFAGAAWWWSRSRPHVSPPP